MSILKTVYLQHLNGASPNATLDANGNMTVTGTVAGNAMGMRNRIINGDMRIDQRMAGGSVSFTVGGQYFIDRWCGSASASSKMTVQQSSTAPTGFSNSLFITSSTAWSLAVSDYATLNQYIEGYNVADLLWGTVNAKPITVSFWVRSSLTGTFAGAINNQINAASPTRSYAFSYTISSANTWEQKIVTIPGDITGTWGTTSSGGISIIFSLAAGSNYTNSGFSWGGVDAKGVTGQVNLLSTNGATFYLTGVQLESGTIATPFERRFFGQELALCQRYFEKSGSIINALKASSLTSVVQPIYSTTVGNGVYYSSIGYMVEKRIPPAGNSQVYTYPYTTPTNTGRVSNDVGTDLAASSGDIPVSFAHGFSVRNASGGSLTTGSQNMLIFNWASDVEL